MGWPRLTHPRVWEPRPSFAWAGLLTLAVHDQKDHESTGEPFLVAGWNSHLAMASLANWSRRSSGDAQHAHAAHAVVLRNAVAQLIEACEKINVQIRIDGHVLQ